MTHTEHPPDIPTQVIAGVACTNRPGIARLAGWKPGRSVDVRAGKDPDFPAPVGVPQLGESRWYPLAGDHGVYAYIALLGRRAQDKKPQPIRPGNPDELLRPDDAAHAMHIESPTFRSYVRYSIPYWTGTKTGRPLLPYPDDVQGGPVDGDHVRRRWRRSTLADHQATRPGPGNDAGRPGGAGRTRI